MRNAHTGTALELNFNNFLSHKITCVLQFFGASCFTDNTPEYEPQMKESSDNFCVLVTSEGRLFWDTQWKYFVMRTLFIHEKESYFLDPEKVLQLLRTSSLHQVTYIYVPDVFVQ